MRFYHDHLCVHPKDGQAVPGDVCASLRTEDGTVLVLCDGIGSGIYANVAAIACSNRILEMVRQGVSLRETSEMVAASMHRARKEDVPFSAFSAAMFFPDGQFVIYSYESPPAAVILNDVAVVTKPRFYTVDYEAVGEVTGHLEPGDSVVLWSDGVTQAGLGRRPGLGIGAPGAVRFINSLKPSDKAPERLPSRIVNMCASLQDGKYEDDTTVALIHCRLGRQLTLFTGPPSKPILDKTTVEAFMARPGKKVVCGSTTADIVARETGRQVNIVKISQAFSSPPEYAIAGVDLVTEGAVMLNQVYNILGEPSERFEDNSVVERLCLMLMEADEIYLMVGNAANDAHLALVFQQLGVRIRNAAVNLIAERLREMGKLVVEEYF